MGAFLVLVAFAVPAQAEKGGHRAPAAAFDHGRMAAETAHPVPCLRTAETASCENHCLGAPERPLPPQAAPASSNGTPPPTAWVEETAEIVLPAPFPPSLIPPFRRTSLVALKVLLLN